MLKTREDLFEHNCVHCGKLFRNDKKYGTVCPDCTRERKREQNRSYKAAAREREKNKQSPAITILEMARKIEKYNREHKTNYTYGQFMDKVSKGEIII